jgi:UDP-N-acetylmuramyl pentapeptide phosphotransferase/UDP-N-acetylglucosamine-1-phosphate transferase
LEWHELVLAGLALFLSLTIRAASAKLPALSRRADDLGAVQAMHTRRTPRLGGLAIFATLGLSVWLAPVDISSRYALFFGATSLLFVVGLAEDLGFHVSPRNRLLAAVAASGLCIALLGVWLPRLGIPAVDPLMGAWWLGVPVTLLVTAGVANGFNLIDGVNGLAGLTAMVALLAMGQIANAGGYDTMLHLSAMVAACVFGFWVVNYPLGLVFWGDAGAYTLGFVISWFGVAVLLNVPAASPWAILLTVYWPVADTLLAIYRHIRRRGDVAAPDRLHVHQMVMRALEICVLGRNRRRLANPMTTLVLCPFVCMPPVVGVLLWNQNALAFYAVLAFSVLFFSSYALAPRLITRFRR